MLNLTAGYKIFSKIGPIEEKNKGIFLILRVTKRVKNIRQEESIFLIINKFIMNFLVKI